MRIRIEAHQYYWDQLDEEDKHVESYIKQFEVSKADDIEAVLDWWQQKVKASQHNGHIVYNVIDLEEEKLAEE